MTGWTPAEVYNTGYILREKDINTIL